jgi:hypothetical protein
MHSTMKWKFMGRATRKGEGGIHDRPAIDVIGAPHTTVRANSCRMLWDKVTQHAPTTKIIYRGIRYPQVEQLFRRQANDVLLNYKVQHLGDE